VLRKKLLVASGWEDSPALQALSEELPDVPESLIQHFLKDKAVSLVARLRLENQEVVLKKYRCATLSKRLSRAVRVSKAQWSWWACGEMAALGIPAMQRVLCFERRLGPLQFDPVFIGSWVSGPNMIEHLTSPDLDETQRDRDARCIVERIGKMHAAGLVHGDLNWTNIRFSEDGPPFVDLDDMRRYRAGPRRDYRMSRDWRVLLYTWRDHAEMQQRFRTLLREHLGTLAFDRVTSRAFRD